MSTQNISIRRITNTGPMGIQLTIGDIVLELVPDQLTEEYTIPVGEDADAPLEISMVIPAGGVIKSQAIRLWFTEVKSKNQFYFTTQNEAHGPQAVNFPTKPGGDVSLGIGYSGDGVVIVGTGDM